MAFSNIFLLSVALLLTFSRLSSGNPALDQANATASTNKTNALKGVDYAVQVGGNGNALNHDVQSSYIYCSSSSTCWRSSTGYSSTCYNGYCVCDIGYHLNTYDQCVQTTCTFDSDCSQAETRCNFNNKCVCNYGYYQDPTSQTCKYSYYPSSGGGAGEAVGFSFGGFIFLIIIISLCVLCCRNRRQRIVRVVGPNVQQQQPRPGFVQPQPGYAYQQQQGYQQGYQPQQQPMPMPQPSAYPNPNYQQQQVQQQQQAPPPPYNPAFAASPSGYPSIGGKI